MKDNFLLVFSRFIKVLGVKVTFSSIEKYLALHPESHSLISYCDALTEWNIENAALQVNKSELAELPVPHIAFLNKDGGSFTVVTKASDDCVFRFDPQIGTIKETLADYIKVWSGIVLLAEPNENSGERDFERKRQAELIRNSRIPLSIISFIVAFISLFALGPLHTNIAFTSFFLLLNLTGLVTCTLLLIQSVNKQNNFLQKLCNVGRHSSCQDILQSKAANIISWLSWSEAGFLYFSASTFVLLISNISSAGINNFGIIGFVSIALSLIFYS
jgi:hypothetical protein